MSRRRRDSYYDGWAPYVPVAQRRAQAKREVSKLKKKGQDIRPVEIEGRTIARSFWGKGWCTHLESFGDYSNRLPRGRTYVRNGSVCHLGIARGKVDAIVSGSDLYRITVDHEELITAGAAADEIAGAKSRRARRRTLGGKDLESVFGVDLDDTTDEAPSAAPKRRPTARKTKPKKSKTKPRAPRPHKAAPFKPTARSVAALRRRLNMSKAGFARAVGVSTATVTNWERAAGAVKPQAKGLAGLIRLHDSST